jgi:hypothetical protein
MSEVKMNLALLLKLLHVFTAIWLIAGLIGRYVALAIAGHSRDVHAILAVLPAAGIFERRMVIPGSAAVLVAGIVTTFAEGWPILGFIQGGASNWVLVSLVLFLTINPLIILVFIPRGKVFEAALQQAIARDQVTPELTAAFNDPLVRAGHIYELVIVAVIICLMVLKPF